VLSRIAFLWQFAGDLNHAPAWLLLVYLAILLSVIGSGIAVFSWRARKRGMPSYERFVAWRYLRDAHTSEVLDETRDMPRWVEWLYVVVSALLLNRIYVHGRRTALIVATVLLCASLGLHIYLGQIERIGAEAIFNPPTQLELILGQVRYVLLGLGLSALVLGLLRLVFSVFTTISIAGVCLGTMALIVVLSVMSGFEGDLKRKILGTFAHVVVSADDGIENYDALVDEIRKVPGVTAAAPYLENEAMAASISNMSGVLVRGIDPVAVVHVNDLDRNIRYGKLEHLVHPEKIEKEEYFKPVPGSPLDVPPPLTPPPPSGSGAQGNLAIPLPGVGDGGVLIPPALDGGAVPPVPLAPDAGGMMPPAPPAPTRTGLEDFPPRGIKPGEPMIDDELRPRAGGPVGLVKAPPEKEPRKDLPGIIIGRELSKNLRILVGDEVHIVSPQGDIGPTGPIPKSRLFRVAGVFYSGMYEYDTKFVYVTIPVAQKFFRQRSKVTGIEVKTTSLDAAHEVARRIEQRISEVPALRAISGLKVKSWQELNKNLFSALKLEKAAMFIVLTFIVLVASFSIVCNLIMVVLEKGREIAIMKSMGASDRSVLRIFVLQGLYIGLIGVSIGLIFGLGICVYLKAVGLALDPEVYYISRLPVMVKEGEIITVALASVGLSLLATLYPALVAARLRPVDGLRFQ
jgi:lipoprotein-releasing system permease protein